MTAALITRKPGALQHRGGSRRHGETPFVATAAALTLGTLLLHLSQLHQSIFGDELWTLQQVAGRSFGGMLHAIRPPGENAPPLFFILAWAAARLGEPSVWYRLPSLIFGVATVPTLYLLGRQTVGRWAGLFAAAAFALSPFATYYGIEARPYAATAFFVVLSTLALVAAVRRGRVGWWVLYAFAAAGAAYSGYTSVFVLVTQAAWSLWVWRARPARPLLANAGVVALYAPWLPHVAARQLAVIGSLEPFTVHHALDDLLRVTVGYPYASVRAIPTLGGLAIIGGCLLGGALTLALARLGGGSSDRTSVPSLAAGRPRLAAAGRLAARLTAEPRDPSAPDEPGGLGLLAALAVATPIGLALYSLLATDVWDSRDLYASLPAALLLSGALVASLAPAPRALVGLAVLATLGFGTARALGPFARPQFRVAAAYLDRVAGPRDPVVMYPSFLDLDAAIPAQFQRPHRIIDGIPARWPAPPPGGATFVVFDGWLRGHDRVPLPHPPGYVFAGARQYGGLVAFTVATYRPA